MKTRNYHTEKNDVKRSLAKKKRNAIERVKNDMRFYINCMSDRGDIKNADYHHLWSLIDSIK